MLNHHKNPHHTFMYLWIVGALVVLVVGMWGYALNHPRIALAPAPTIEQPTVAVEEMASTTRTLAQGEVGNFGTTTLTIDRVLEDSRCPQSVQCIQAGTVRVSSTMASGMGTSTLVLKLGETSTTETHTVTLVSVEPYPKTPGALSLRDYHFLVRLENR